MSLSSKRQRHWTPASRGDGVGGLRHSLQVRDDGRRGIPDQVRNDEEIIIATQSLDPESKVLLLLLFLVLLCSKGPKRKTLDSRFRGNDGRWSILVLCTFPSENVCDTTSKPGMTQGGLSREVKNTRLGWWVDT